MKKAIITSAVTIAATTILFAMTSTGVFAKEVTYAPQQEKIVDGVSILKIMYPNDAVRKDIDQFKTATISAVAKTSPLECATTLVNGMNGIGHGSLYTLILQNNASGEKREFRVNITKKKMTGDCKDVK